jgi:hypothetical protein
MAPSASRTCASRLVDREPAQPGPPEAREKIARGEPLGRHEQQVERPGLQPSERIAALVVVLAGIQGRGRDAERAHLLDLVAHERDQRRDDHRQPAIDEGGQLVAHRLAAAGRHHGEHVRPREHGSHDLGLAGPEIVVAEHVFQEGAGAGEVGHGCGRPSVGPKYCWVRPLGRRQGQQVGA